MSTMIGSNTSVSIVTKRACYKALIIALLLCAYGFVVSEVEAAQIYKLKEDKRIYASISASEKNRIVSSMMPITKIIGDEAKYQVLTDDSNRNLFLLPNVKAGEVIEISLADSSGRVIDLSLKVKDGIEGQIIILGDDNKNGRSAQKTWAERREEEIKNLLHAMIKGENYKRKYFVSTKQRKINLLINIEPELVETNEDNAQIAALTKNYEIVQERTYSYQDLIGVRLLVANNSGRAVEVEKNDFANIFERIRAITISNKALAAKAKSYVYIVALKRKE